MSEAPWYREQIVKMSPDPESPNGLWIRLGYTVERITRNRRVIRRPDGSIVDTTPIGDECEYAAERRAALAELTED